MIVPGNAAQDPQKKISVPTGPLAIPQFPQDPQPISAPPTPAVPSAPPVDQFEQERQRDFAQFEADAGQQRRDLVTSMRLASQDDPEVAGEVQRIGQQLGIKPEFASQNIDVARTLVRERAMKLDEMRKNAPTVWAMLEKAPFRAIAWDDLVNLNATEGFFASMDRNIGEGQLGNELNYIGLRQAIGLATQAENDRADEIDMLLARAPQSEGFFRNAAEIGGQMSQTLPLSLAAGGVGAAGGSVVPGVGTGAGFTAGLATGTFAVSGALQAGGAYRQLIKRGVPPDIAVPAAFGEGAIVGGLEAFAGSVAAAPFKGALRSALARGAAATLTKDTAKGALHQFVKNYAKTWAAQTGEELTQDIASHLIQNAVASGVPGAKAGEDLGSTLWATFEKVGSGMALLSLPGPGAQFVADGVRAREVQQKTRAFLDIAAQAEASKVRGRNPDAYAEAVTAMGEKHGVGSVFVDADKLRDVLFQSDKKAVEEAAKMSGADPEQMARDLPADLKAETKLAKLLPAVAKQLADGSEQVEIPAGDFAAKLVGTAEGSSLATHVKFDPNGMSPAEAAQFEKDSPGAIKEMKAEAEKLMAANQQIREEAKAIEDELHAQIVASGISPVEAKTNAETMTASIVALANAQGMSPKALFESERLKVQSGETIPVHSYGQDDADAARLRAVMDDVVTLGKELPPPDNTKEFGGSIDLFSAAPNGTNFKALRQRFVDDPRWAGHVKAYESGLSEWQFGQEMRAVMKQIEADKRKVQHEADIDELMKAPEMKALVQAIREQTKKSSDEATKLAIEEIQRKQFEDSMGGGREGTDPNILRQGGEENLAQNSASKTDTPAFKKWFGASVVVDENGAPLLVFHGSNNASFQTFDLGRFPGGAYFTDSYGEAYSYTRGRGKDGVRGYYIRMVRPFIVEANGQGYDKLTLSDEDLDRIGFPIQERNRFKALGKDLILSTDIIASFAKDAGFDGVIFKGVIDNLNTTNGIGGKESTVYVSFDRASIKSDNNRGTYDGTDPNTLHQGEKENRGGFNPIHNVITLLKKSDSSTLMHEFAHYYLEVIGRLAARPDATAQVKADFATLMKFAGVEDPAAWATMDFAARKKPHEKIAYSFEGYLYDGKAPSKELEGAFSRIRTWMLAVYKSIRSGINDVYKSVFNEDLPVLTPEVRQVFDRMLASQEDIDAQMAMREAAIGFQTKEQALEAGVTEEEWANVQALEGQARDDAVAELQARSLKDGKWVQDASARQQATLNKLERAEREAVRLEEEAAVRDLPVYRAIEFIKKGTLDGQKKQEKHKLDREEVRALLGLAKPSKEAVDPNAPVDAKKVEAESLLAKLEALGILINNGLAPDDVASIALPGTWNTGESMVRAILEARPIEEEIAARTDARMLAEHAELMDPKARRLAIAEAIHNETRARALATQIVALQHAAEQEVLTTKQKATRDAAQVELDALAEERKGLRKELSEARSQEIDRNVVALKERIADLNEQMKAPRKVVARADSASARALVAAAREVAQNILNNTAVRDISPSRFLGAEARAARAVLNALKKGDHVAAVAAQRSQLVQNQLVVLSIGLSKTIEKQKRDMLKALTTDAKKHDLDYVLAARGILSAFSLDGARKVLPREWLAEVELNDPVKFNELDGILREAAGGNTLQDYRQLTLEQWLVLHHTVTSLMWKARRENEIGEIGDRIGKDEAIGLLFNRLVETMGPVPDDKTPRQVITDKDRSTELWAGGTVWLKRVEFWASKMDGGQKDGPFTRFIFRRLRDKFSTYMVERGKMFRVIEKHVAKLTGLDGAKIDTPFPGMTNGVLGTYAFANKSELLGAVLQMGTLSNLVNLLAGNGWAEFDENGEISAKSVQAWYDFIEDMIEKGHLNKADFDFAAATWKMNDEVLRPQSQRTNHDLNGEYFDTLKPLKVINSLGTWDGGYMPSRPDKEQSKSAGIFQREGLQGLADSARNTAGAMNTGAKPGFLNARKKKAVYPRIQDMRVQLQYVDEALRFIHLQPAIVDIVKLLKTKKLANALNYVDKTAIDGLLVPWLERTQQNQVERNFTPLVDIPLRFLRKAVGVGRMFLNLPNSLQQLTGFGNSRNYVKGSKLRAAAWHLLSTKGSVQAILDKSNFMLSMENVSGEARREIDLMLNSSWVGKLDKVTDKYGYVLQKVFQGSVNYVTWLGAYNQSLEESATGDPKAEAKAISDADAAVRMSQGSASAPDIARYENSYSPVKIITQFQGYWNTVWNQIAAADGTKQKLATAMRSLVIPAVISSAIVSALAGDELDDEDGDGWVMDEFAKWFFMSQVKAAAALVPGGSIAMSMVETQPGVRASVAPAFTVMKDAVDTVYLAFLLATGNYDKELTSRDAKRAASTASLVPGLQLFPGLARPIISLFSEEKQ